MTKIEVFDIEAERISDIEDDLECSSSFVVEALFNMLDNEARMRNMNPTDVLKEYI